MLLNDELRSKSFVNLVKSSCAEDVALMLATNMSRHGDTLDAFGLGQKIWQIWADMGCANAMCSPLADKWS